MSTLMAVMLVFVLSSCTKERTAVREDKKPEPQPPTGIIAPAWADTLYHGFIVDATWGDTLMYLQMKYNMQTTRNDRSVADILKNIRKVAAVL